MLGRSGTSGCDGVVCAPIAHDNRAPDETAETLGPRRPMTSKASNKMARIIGG